MGGSRALQKILSSGSVRKSSVNLGLQDQQRGSVVHGEAATAAAVESQEPSLPVDNSNNDDEEQLYQPRPATSAAAANSIEATLQKELKALEVRYFRTRLQQEKTAEKVLAIPMTRDHQSSRAHDITETERPAPAGHESSAR